MKRLLHLEFLKLYNYKTARIFIILYFVLLASMGFIVTIINPSIGGVTINLARYGAYIFPYVWQNITYFADYASLFLAIIVITNITNEYTNRTLKQNLIDGLTKKEFLASKLLTALSFAALSSVLIFFVCLGLGLYYTENPTSIFTGVEFIFTYFLKLCVFFSFCTLIAFAIRKSGFAFMIVFLWRFLEVILKGIELWMNNGDKDAFFISNYLPANAAAKSLPLPNIRIESLVKGENIFYQTDISISGCIVTILYIALFIWLSYLLLKKRDL